MVSHDARPVMQFVNDELWETWLRQNHATSDGVRLRVKKLRAPVEGLPVTAALDVALCYGWIDGTRRSLDEDWFYQDYGPRRARSLWSKVNRDHTERLITAGRMQPAGLAEIDRARGDGRWEAAYRQRDMPVPPELQEALAANPVAAAFFETLSAQNRFAILFRISTLKRPESRTAKTAMFVGMLERGETVY